MNPAASVIIPCRDAGRTIVAAVASVLESEFGDIEVLAINDGSTDSTEGRLKRIAEIDGRLKILNSGGKGVSAARNAGLDVARGEFVFFCDADDLFEPTYIGSAIMAMRTETAQYCISGYATRTAGESEWRVVRPKDDYSRYSPEEIITRYLPRIFGYSFDDVRAWYGGKALFQDREMAQVWRAAFRRDIIERYHVRFDETISLNEDAMFNAEYLLHVQHMAVLTGGNYRYTVSDSGAMRSQYGGRAFFANKLQLKAKREALDAMTVGRLTDMYSASCVLSLFEILKGAFQIRGCMFLALKTFIAYLRDPLVIQAVRKFPLSFRKPLLAGGVMLVRGLTIFAK